MASVGPLAYARVSKFGRVEPGMNEIAGDKMRVMWTLRSLRWIATCIPMVLLGACGGDSASSPPPMPAAASINVLSTRADLITGDTAYVEIVLPEGATGSDIQISLAGRDVTQDFAVRANGRRLGLATGLVAGDNVLTVAGSEFTAAKITLVSHPVGGPLVSGAQMQPWVCATPAPTPAPSRPDPLFLVLVRRGPLGLLRNGAFGASGSRSPVRTRGGGCPLRWSGS